MVKIAFRGIIKSIQPRIRLTRSFDEASHTYLGYSIMLDGELGNQQTRFSIGISEAANAKQQLQVNDTISGECLPVLESVKESVDYYKVSKLKVISRGEKGSVSAPWEMASPELEIYKERGHRRLAARTYDSKCSSCIWGARMPVEIIVDNWNPRGLRKHRFETFCYGPKSCKYYKAGPNRKVEGRHGMVWIEEDWIDEMAVEHRGPDE